MHDTSQLVHAASEVMLSRQLKSDATKPTDRDDTIVTTK